MQMILRTQDEIRNMIDFLIENNKICSSNLLRDQNKVRIEKLQEALHFSKLPENKDDETFLWLVKHNECK